MQDKADDQTIIPKILHQTWKDEDLPPDLETYRCTWQTHHPDWEYHLWTDTDNREFLRRHYQWFLPIYDSYPEPIMRVDAVRYFILYTYGGVYADLDAECLRPLEPMLSGKQIIFGLENPDHLEMPLARERSLTKIVGNAFIASVPKHLFWDKVFRQLVACHHLTGPLDATGPFMMTRTYDTYSDKKSISLEPHERLYPISNDTIWSEMPPDKRNKIIQRAYVIHHWKGSWWKPSAAKQGRQVKATLFSKGRKIDEAMIQIAKYRTLLHRAPKLPRISCLMVTGNRATFARQSVNCFQRQTYPNKELVIIDDGGDDSLEEWINMLGDDRIVYIRLPDQNKPLGELRNLSVEKASGAYVAQWDDDDLSDPKRLEVQMAAIHVLKTATCFLERHQIWWPETRRLALSTRRFWEGSVVCARDRLPPYPAIRKGEDTPVMEQIVKEERVALLDFPQLYVYIFHGDNTFAASHWEQHWLAATESYENDRYSQELRGLQKRLNLDLKVLSERSQGFGRQCEKDGPNPANNNQPDKSAVASPTWATFPKVLILIPVKDAAPFLPRLWDNLNQLAYPHQRISLAFLESDSIDGTYTAIEQKLPDLQEVFAGVKLIKRDYGFRPALPRWEPELQYKRRSILAKSRNTLLARGLQDEDWVLWIDVDVARWPRDVIERLLAAEKEIVVPNCLALGSRETFDYNTFKLKPGAEDLDWSSYMIDGILQPPKGYGRFYLSDLRRHNCVEIDAVGGTMLLIRAEIHRAGLVFPSYSYRGHIETEELALMAKDMGYKCWGLPNLEIFHGTL